jgi:hypothetical protein
MYYHVSGVSWLIITGSGSDDCIYWHFYYNLSFLITIIYERSQSMTAKDSIRSLLDYECLLFHCNWFGSALRIGQFFSFRCPLVEISQLNIQLLNFLTMEWLNSQRTLLNWTLQSITCPPLQLGVNRIETTPATVSLLMSAKEPFIELI